MTILISAKIAKVFVLYIYLKKTFEATYKQKNSEHLNATEKLR